jgi:hypothetical protein
MKQILQSLETGTIEVAELPSRSVGAGLSCLSRSSDQINQIPARFIYPS